MTLVAIIDIMHYNKLRQDMKKNSCFRVVLFVRNILLVVFDIIC